MLVDERSDKRAEFNYAGGIASFVEHLNRNKNPLHPKPIAFEVEGVPTTIAAARDILRSDEFDSGQYSTSFLAEAGARLPALAGAA